MAHPPPGVEEQGDRRARGELPHHDAAVVDDRRVAHAELAGELQAVAGRVLGEHADDVDPRFDPDFVGLTGGGARTRQALDALKAPRTEILPPEAPATPHPHEDGDAHAGHSHTTGSGQKVEHTGTVHVFLGDRVVLYSGGTTPTQYAADFAALLRR